MEIPRSMMYAMRKIPAVNSSAILRSFAASNGNTFDVNSNEIRIPVNCDGFLDGAKSYFSFTINNTGANAFELDTYGLSWCDQIRIEANGQVLERVERAGVYDNLRRKWTKGQAEISKQTVVAGGAVGGGATLGNDGRAIATTKTLALAMDLPLGFLHAHHGRAVPKGSSFDIVLRVNSTLAQCFKYATGATAFTITNARFYAPVYQVEDSEVMSEYGAALQERGISWSGDTVKSYINSLTAGAGTQTLQINDRSKSLLGLLTVARSNAQIAAFGSNSIGASTLEGFTQVRTTIGGRNYPPDNISVSTVVGGEDGARLYTECAKVLAPEGHYECNPAVVASTYLSIAADGTEQGVVAVDLKKFDDEKLAMVGLDTASNGSPSTIEIITAANALACETVTYALCEARWELNGQGMLSVSM